jgi:hypothetical protein
LKHSHCKLNDDQVVIENLPDNNGKIVRQCITIKLSSNNGFIKQRCFVCDKLLAEIKPENSTKIRIKCKGCLVVNEITYSM